MVGVKGEKKAAEWPPSLSGKLSCRPLIFLPRRLESLPTV